MRSKTVASGAHLSGSLARVNLPWLWIPLVLAASVPAMEPVALRYATAPGAASCPDEQALRAAVASMLGTNPWSSPAARTMIVRLEGHPGVWRAEVIMVDDRAEVLGRRVLVSRQRDCRELFDAVTLAVSLAIDPGVALRPIPSAAPLVPAPPRPQPTPVARTMNVPSPRSKGPALQYLASTGVALGVAHGPIPTLGLVAGAGLKWNAWSARVEFRSDAPGFVNMRGGAAGLSTQTLTAVPCWEAAWLQTCGLGTVGVASVLDQGELDLSRRTMPYAAVGARVGGMVPADRWLRMNVALDGSWVLTRYRLREQDSGKVRWRSTPVALGLHWGITAIFP